MSDGRHWQAIWHDQDILNIGCLAIDPSDPAVLYCGTGEANLSADSYPGVGLYRSQDSGATWELLAACTGTGIPRRIGTIAVDPFDPKRLFLGGVGAYEASPIPDDVGGLYISSDRGVSWRRQTFVSTSNYWCHAVVCDPVHSGVVFATCTENGAKSGIWRSRDAGRNWTQLKAGLPAPERFGRTSLAISLADPNIVYAFAEDELSGRSDLLLGVFRSSDGGDTWNEIGGGHFRGEGQISYGNTIAVFPDDPDRVICGGVDLHMTTNGGRSWNKITHWDLDRTKPTYAHADHHRLLIPAANPNRVYDPNDGGLDVSDDGGRTWSNRSNGLAATMFYDMDVAQTDGRCFGGGAQDNGTVVTTTGQSGTFGEILGGDGGWMIYDPADIGHMYASLYNMGISRLRSGRWMDVSPPAPKAEKNAVWMVYITMDPANSKIVFTGTTRVWRTKKDGAAWEAVSPPLDGGSISAIEISEADSRRVYIGTENGGFFRSLDGGDTWSSNLSSATLPGHMITRIESAKRLGADTLVATVGNFGHSHVFGSKDGGRSWTDLDRGLLPDVPHHAVLIPPDNPQCIYVGNDAGVFVSSDWGGHWSDMTGNLPNAMVIDLVYHRRSKTLHAATYGRSLWRAKL